MRARNTSLHVLDRVRIASPCHVSWASMSGDERVRFCGSCRKHVYNFAAMTSDEIETLIVEKEGRLCGRLYRRADGSVLTADCPVGRRIVRRKAARLVACVAAVLFFALQAFAYIVPAGRRGRLTSYEPFATIASRLSPQPVIPPILISGIVSVSPPSSRAPSDSRAVADLLEEESR